ncbi:tail fiber assembly protein [Photorhabdus africana]|nr:tail fiber assembly protein [Photorhabdus sp. CRI-LC]
MSAYLMYQTLLEWKKYLAILNRVDTSKASEIDWST